MRIVEESPRGTGGGNKVREGKPALFLKQSAAEVKR